MNGFPWFSRRTPLAPDMAARRDRLPDPQALDARPLRQQRFVVLDLETSGLNMSRDLVLSIGAVSIDDGAIDLGNQFECTLQRETGKLNASVLIHGIAPSELAAGVEPAEALLGFMEFLGDSPLLAFHATFDQRMLSRALKQDLDHRLRHCFLDIAELAPMLCPESGIRNGGLDQWVEYFGLQVQQRHNASADALVTAEIALILFSRARRQGLETPAALASALARWQRRQHVPAL
ncbi:3'-5' exonuclease [Pseudomonas sp. JS3066]|jgi:DNA polymerase-3 subunit epsilon|uniref:3'-5' exonuclease n=1 Tax=unclassified Pseudomonas TaxID=196821 RepID=UPI000EAA9C8A|nr:MULTISPECIES: 3'-5' exonuclease [unclassified Pseudomonas]AYF88914.1 3'-5' exonuclease [Pseudomonas sp. DY-1]MDH4653446.1 3'-5' exonuclease [Pseudomonas sp. BN606]MRK22323.1 3'-5' exonuclease [Pseudomonas sp. JG-B]WVK93545.1 3'-5' exonuclease [Pseudomonas sp. JS3066]